MRLFQKVDLSRRANCVDATTVAWSRSWLDHNTQHTASQHGVIQALQDGLRFAMLGSSGYSLSESI